MEDLIVLAEAVLEDRDDDGLRHLAFGERQRPEHGAIIGVAGPVGRPRPERRAIAAVGGGAGHRGEVDRHVRRAAAAADHRDADVAGAFVDLVGRCAQEDAAADVVVLDEDSRRGWRPERGAAARLAQVEEEDLPALDERVRQDRNPDEFPRLRPAEGHEARHVGEVRAGAGIAAAGRIVDRHVTAQRRAVARRGLPDDIDVDEAGAFLDAVARAPHPDHAGLVVVDDLERGVQRIDLGRPNPGLCPRPLEARRDQRQEHGAIAVDKLVIEDSQDEGGATDVLREDQCARHRIVLPGQRRSGSRYVAHPRLERQRAVASHGDRDLAVTLLGFVHRLREGERRVVVRRGGEDDARAEGVLRGAERARVGAVDLLRRGRPVAYD